MAILTQIAEPNASDAAASCSVKSVEVAAENKEGQPSAEKPMTRVEGPHNLAAEAMACLVWPCICALPLCLTCGRDSAAYRSFFPAAWYDEVPRQPPRGVYGLADPRDAKPLGLILGILAVAVGQVFVLTYHALRRSFFLGELRRVQTQVRTYNFFEGLVSHLSQPEGFLLIGGYLVGTWMLGWMPASYYSFAGGINWVHVFAQLLLQDSLQYFMHLCEHKVSSWIYRRSHKPHHRFTNPRLFDAFDGSLTDTSLMIIVPFVIVARVVPANVWSYMCFGSIYANWLVLIHSEYYHPWDVAFKRIGFGTPGDHHVHHRFFIFNFGHLFMYWDKLFGTYRDPRSTPKEIFNKDL